MPELGHYCRILTNFNEYVAELHNFLKYVIYLPHISIFVF